MKCPSCPRILQWTDGAFCAECMKPAPSPQPEMPDGMSIVELAHMQSLSESAKLHNFEARTLQKLLREYKRLTVVGPAERAVLDAAATGDPGELTWLDSWCERVWEAELARRGSQ